MAGTKNNTTRLYLSQPPAHPDPPRNLILEAHEGCLSDCPGCGVRAIAPHAPGARNMTRSTVAIVAEEMARLGWRDVNVIFSGRGEPTLNRDLAGLINTMVTRWPRSRPMVWTGGSGLTTSGRREVAEDEFSRRLSDLFVAGMTTLVVNTAAASSSGLALLTGDFGMRIAALNDADVHHWPCDPDDPRRRDSWPFSQLNEVDGRIMRARRRIVLCRHFGLHTGQRDHRVQDQAGCCLPPPRWRAGDQRHRVCLRPTQELFVRHDGLVSICQADWRGRYIAGDVLGQPLNRVWDGPEMGAARRLLRHGRRRSGEPCARCEDRLHSGGFHHGPNPPRPGDVALFAEISSRPPASQVRLQPWESPAPP